MNRARLHASPTRGFRSAKNRHATTCGRPCVVQRSDSTPARAATLAVRGSGCRVADIAAERFLLDFPFLHHFSTVFFTGRGPPSQETRAHGCGGSGAPCSNYEWRRLAMPVHLDFRKGNPLRHPKPAPSPQTGCATPCPWGKYTRIYKNHMKS